MNYIANVADNRQLYKKAYLLEFLGEDGKTPEDAFCFSVPPESEELTYTQRKTETKTFGGLHVDDYGIDAAKIILSGSTINQELKRIYRGDKSEKWLTGEEEIYYLRDLIQQYKTETVNLKKKILLYDLSKTKSENASSIKNYWQVFIGDFKIRRSSDRPFTYKYTLELTAIPLEEADEIASNAPPEMSQEQLDKIKKDVDGDSEAKKQSLLAKLKAKYASALSDIREARKGLVYMLSFIDGINGKVNNVLNDIKQVSDLLKIMGNIMTYSANTISGMAGSIGDTAAGFIDGADRIVQGYNSIVSLPRAIQTQVIDVGLKLQNATNRLVKSTDELRKSFNNYFDKNDNIPQGDAGQGSSNQGSSNSVPPESIDQDDNDNVSQEIRSQYVNNKVPQEILDQYGMSNEEFKDTISIMLDKIENTVNEIASAAKSSFIPDVILGNPDPKTGEAKIVLAYGYTSVMLKDTDTLESLAAKYFGDPDKAIDIAIYNSIASINELKAGDIIKLPIASNNKNTNNRIFSRREDRDNYGRDISLTDDGFITPSTTGDYALVSGVKNLSQAILLRLRESVSKRIRLNTYGIRSSIGDPSAGIAYITSSIDLTVNSDPRVAAVEDIRFTGERDYLFVNVFYSDINGASGNASGRT